VISGTPTATLTSTSFTVTATNGAGNSTGNVSLTVNAACPTNYILVPYNAAAGTNSDFCVSKYEMKCVGSSCPTAIASANAVPTSQAASNPWVSISQTNSIAACSYLNTLNGVSNKYALISNEEWMTIARNIELVNANWSSNSAGVNVLARGHTDNSPANALAASTDDSPYYLTGNTSAQAANSGWEQKRTLTLSNSEVIWDFAGNVWEWVNWQVTPANKAYVSADGSPQAAWREFNLINTLIGPTDEMPPEKWASSFVWNFTTNAAQASPLNGNNGIGRYYAGNNSTGGAALRGGGWDDASSAGAFSLALNHSAGSSNAYIGFRCVFRP
jgi:formylglycine-generating enzyme required for sulfatase activity